MFLHIGNNVLIKNDELIGIFNVSALLEDVKGRKFFHDVVQKKEVMDISGGKQTSLVVTEDRTYISRISTATLLGRSEYTLQEMLNAEYGPSVEADSGVDD